MGSVRTLSDGNGILIKEIAYDSFGNVTRDTLPQFFFPLGFAGGLTDPHTGFIRFGFRDYDPVTGRFTAKDPLGDTGGDHDLYDYCVDDPVSFVDPEGLAAQGVVGQGWNEALHPRTPDGRFTFKGEGNYGNQSQRPGAVAQDASSLPLPSPQPLTTLAVQAQLQPSTLHILPEWANDPGMLEGLRTGWAESNPYAPDALPGQPTIKQEQGGWIIKNPDGSYVIERWPGGERDRITPTPKP